MSQDLTGSKIKDSYQQILHVDGGVTSTDKTVYDGDGTATGLKVSTTGVDISVLKLNGALITATAQDINANADAQEQADIATAQAVIATTQAGIATSQASISTTKANESATSADEAAQSALESAASASSAAQIVYGNLIMHPNRIDVDIAIPDGYNAFYIDPVEFGADVTVTGLGNSTLRGV